MATDVESRFRKRLLIVLGLLVAAVAFLIAAVNQKKPPAVRDAVLRQNLAACASSAGFDVKVRYENCLSEDAAVFDVQSPPSSARRMDVVHLVLQFGHELDKTKVSRLVLARRGYTLYYIHSTDLKELTREYTSGDKLWAINHLPERLKGIDGSPAYPTRTGSASSIAAEQEADVDSIIANLTAD